MLVHCKQAAALFEQGLLSGMVFCVRDKVAYVTVFNRHDVNVITRIA
jgi:hypothetical protein